MNLTQGIPDVAIVGAGAMGCATAYFLTKAGLRVVMVERDGIASHSSGFAFGGLQPASGAGVPGPVLSLGKEAFRIHVHLWEALQEETGVDTYFRVTSTLYLARNEEEVRTIRGRLVWQKEAGFQAEWLDADACCALEPRLLPSLLGGVLLQGGGLVESYRYTSTLALATERRGMLLRSGELVGLKVEGNRVKSLVLSSGELSCGQVVLAMGPWMGQVASWLHVPMPVRPLKGQIIHLDASGAGLTHRLSWGDDYAATKEDGRVWVGTTEEDVGFDERITEEAKAQIIPSLLSVAPSLADAQLVDQTACLRPLSADGLPIIGGIPGYTNAYVATGAGRKGILLSAATGRIIADLILKGQSDIPYADFTLDRFMKGSSATS